MTAEIINLRQFRKQKERKENERLAAQNRAQFGRTKADKVQTRVQKARDDAHLDGARINDEAAPTADSASKDQRPDPHSRKPD